MITRRIFIRSLAAGGMMALAESSMPRPALAAGRAFTLATATSGGTYYAAGAAIAALVKVRLQPGGIDLTAIGSAGSEDNLRMLREGSAQFALLQGLYGAYARSGTGPFAALGPQKRLRSIATLWPNIEHFVMLKSQAETRTLADLARCKGKRAAFGRPGSGIAGSSAVILTSLGLSPTNDFIRVDLGLQAAADALASGDIAVMAAPGGLPVPAMTYAFEAIGDDLVILAATDEELAAIDRRFPTLWTRHVVPAGTYPGQGGDVRTIGQPNFLAVSAAVPDDVVYAITEAIFGNLAFLTGLEPGMATVSLDRAVLGLPVPLHPGALRYFDEQGVAIEERLRV